MRDELFLDVGVCILRSTHRLGVCRELGIAIFTHAKHWNIILSSDDPKFAFRHALFSHGCGPDSYPVEIQPAPLVAVRTPNEYRTVILPVSDAEAAAQISLDDAFRTPHA